MRRPYLDPYLIAEIGVNHEGSLEQAKAMIRQASRAGAHAAKFQSYKAEKLASMNSPAYWDLDEESCTSQYELFKKYDGFQAEDYRSLASYCRELGIDFLSTPFDLEAVDFLDPLVPFFKIASADLTNTPLLRKIARTRKPVLLSTGAALIQEIRQAVDELQTGGCPSVTLLHCVLNYPTPQEHAQLGMIQTLQEAFPGVTVGYSDHVPPDPDGSLLALEMACLLGAQVIEKHFTYDKSLSGNDHYHSMDEKDLKGFVDRLARLRTLYGSPDKNLEWETVARREARRSIVTARPIEQGEVLTQENLTTKRPGHGISPLSWDEILGRQVRHHLEEDALLRWEDMED